MMSRRAALFGAVALLSGCSEIGESRYNPLNWFGQSEAADVPSVPERVARVDNRPPVARIADLSLARTPNGVIVTATGVPPAQGYHSASLVLVSQNEGRVTYVMRAIPPEPATRTGSEASRQITAAAFLSRFDLAGVRVIEVLGAENGLAVRR